MPKYIRLQPASARAMSAARVRSPTPTSAPMARNAAARSSLLRTSARTGRSRWRSASTTAPPTPPTRPAAPVTRIGLLFDMEAPHKDESSPRLCLLSGCGPSPAPAEQIDLRAHLAEPVTRRVDAIDP